MSFGSWNVDVNTHGMPQKVATAFGNLTEQLIGAEYTPIAYLGSQIANGTNHAVLAEQLIISGKDTKNIVLMIFNERGMDCNLVNIERVVESGGELGGVKIDVQTNIPDEAMDAFNKVTEGFVGSKIEPFVYLGSQMTKGNNEIFAAVVEPVVENPVVEVVILVVNSMTGNIGFKDILGSDHKTNSFGYAFTW